MAIEIEKTEADIIALEEKMANEKDNFLKSQIEYSLREHKILLKKLRVKYGQPK